MEWKYFPSVDEDGYYVEQSLQGVGDGMSFADDVVETPIPDDVDLEKNYLKWTGSEWKIEAKPTTPEECVLVGVISHESRTARCNELRKLFEELTKDSDTHRLERGEDLSWVVVKIPNEEKEADEAEAALSDFDSKVSSLKDRMSLAMLQGDQEQVTALRAEYQTLMGV